MVNAFRFSLGSFIYMPICGLLGTNLGFLVNQLSSSSVSFTSVSSDSSFPFSLILSVSSLSVFSVDAGDKLLLMGFDRI